MFGREQVFLKIALWAHILKRVGAYHIDIAVNYLCPGGERFLPFVILLRTFHLCLDIRLNVRLIANTLFWSRLFVFSASRVRGRLNVRLRLSLIFLQGSSIRSVGWLPWIFGTLHNFRNFVIRRLVCNSGPIFEIFDLVELLEDCWDEQSMGDKTD